MNNLSIATRIFAIMCISLVFSVAAIVFLLVQIGSVSNRYDQILASEVHQQDQARILEVNFKKQVQEWKDILLRGHDPVALEKYRNGFFEYERKVHQGAWDLKQTVTESQARALLEDFLKAHEKLGASYKAALEVFTHDKAFDFKAADRMVKGMDRPPTDLIDRVVETLQKRVEEVPASLQDTIVFQRWIVAGVTCAVLVIVVLVSSLIARSITRPLNQTMEVLEKVAKGDLTSRLEVVSRDEIGRMALALNQATEALRQAAEKEKRQIETTRLQAEELKQKVDAILVVVNAAAAGDLTQPIAVRGADSIGQMGEGLARFFASLGGNVTNIAHTAQALASASRELTAVSQQLAANSEQTATQANVASTAAVQVSHNVTIVSTNVEELGASIKEIAKNAGEAARVATTAVKVAEKTNATVGMLGESSAEIGNVIKVITSIAQQTNLLALNATIEAARAGEAGKGFAVVANEVKELAKQTADATEEISRKIQAIQGNTKGAVEAISQIGTIINQINDLQSSIASAVEEQTATTSEIIRNVAEAAKGTNEIAHNITGVAQAARSTTEGAGNTKSSADELSRMALDLQKLVAQFKV